MLCVIDEQLSLSLPVLSTVPWSDWCNISTNHYFVITYLSILKIKIKIKKLKIQNKFFVFQTYFSK